MTVSTNLGTWVNRRHLFANEEVADVFQTERIPSAQKWQFTPEGQHIELGIAEMNLFLLLGAAGLSHSLFGERLLPIGTLYDPFISRGLDALNYACYQDARFLLVATPSGVSLAGEGGAHQSIALAADRHERRTGWPRSSRPLPTSSSSSWTGPSTTCSATVGARRTLRPGRATCRAARSTCGSPRACWSRCRAQMDAALSTTIIRGAYWLQPPTPACEVVIAYQGVLASEAIAAAGMIGGERATSRCWRSPRPTGSMPAGTQPARPPARRPLGDLPRRGPAARRAAALRPGHGHRRTSGDARLARRRVRPSAQTLGVEHFGQTGTVTDLYRHFGIDAAAIANAATGFVGALR